MRTMNNFGNDDNDADVIFYSDFREQNPIDLSTNTGFVNAEEELNTAQDNHYGYSGRSRTTNSPRINLDVVSVENTKDTDIVKTENKTNVVKDANKEGQLRYVDTRPQLNDRANHYTLRDTSCLSKQYYSKESTSMFVKFVVIILLALLIIFAIKGKPSYVAVVTLVGIMYVLNVLNNSKKGTKRR